MKKIMFASLLIVPAISFSESSSVSNIDRVEVHDNGFNIYSSGGDFGSAVCAGGDVSTVNNVISFTLADFPNGLSHLLSAALSAYMSGKQVSMWYVGCQVSPWNNGDMPKPSSLVVI